MYFGNSPVNILKQTLKIIVLTFEHSEALDTGPLNTCSHHIVHSQLHSSFLPQGSTEFLFYFTYKYRYTKIDINRYISGHISKYKNDINTGQKDNTNYLKI